LSSSEEGLFRRPAGSSSASRDGHSKISWDHFLVASVRVILRHYGITSGSLVIDDTDNARSKSAKALAHLYQLCDKESGGYIWDKVSSFL
jgi:hypothetical protein